LRWDFDQGGPLIPEGLRAIDLGDLPTDPATPQENRSLITSTTVSILKAGVVPLLLGGDDSVPIPFFAGFERFGPVTILQIDAHLDWRDERDGLKHTFSSTMRRAREMPWVERIIQVGQRSIGGSRERDLADAQAWGVTLFSAATVRRHGVQPVIDLIPAGQPMRRYARLRRPRPDCYSRGAGPTAGRSRLSRYRRAVAWRYATGADRWF
jgi:agmatinase